MSLGEQTPRGDLTLPTDPILVTGCSSGIGAATATLLVRAGYTVYATARRTETLAGLEALGCRTLALDVTSESSMVAAVAAVEAEHGRVGTLVNNAGYGAYGPVEEADLADVRAMFETNVFGLSRLSQLVLPEMREAGGGRIVNIGSMGGRLTFPVGGYYHATKHAVEAISDALRVEVAPFGVHVVLIEPGMIRSGFEGRIASGMAGARAAREARGEGTAYGDLLAHSDEATAASYASPLMSAGPERVARAVLKAVDAPRPRARYVVTPAARALIALRRFGGDRVWDAAMHRRFGW